MIDFGLSAYHAYYRDDVEPYLTVDAAKLDVVVDGQTKALQLAVINSLFRFTE